MRFLQTVSPEMPDRDFRRFWPRFRAKTQSLFVQEGHMPLISRRYFMRKKSNINSLDLVAGEPGFEPGLTESESAGLPLTYSPKPFRHAAGGDCDPDGRRFTHG